MKTGLLAQLNLRTATPDFVRTLARAAEDRGIHRMWLPDAHLVKFDDYSSPYPYSRSPDRKMVYELDEPDPFQALAFMSAVTNHVRLGTSICIVPQRNPVYTAKQVTSLDQLSQGRFDFGVGIGWSREEFAAAAVPWPHRAKRCREYIEVMTTLWRDSVSSYDGEFYTLPPCRQDPKPVQTPHPPIYFGGESEAALRRVADMGQGWLPFDIGPLQLAERVTALQALLSDRGRSLAEIDIAASPFLRDVDPPLLEGYASAGVDEVVAFVRITAHADIEDTLDRLVETVIEPARKL